MAYYCCRIFSRNAKVSMTSPARSPFQQFLLELRRRRVFRVAGAYAVVAWILIQVANDVFPALHLPDWSITLVVVLVLLGFPVALLLGWAYDVTPGGIVRTEAPPTTVAEAATAATAQPRNAIRIALVGAVAVLALAGAAFMATRIGGPAGGPEDADVAARTVAVLPFQVRGSERLMYLSDGIVDLLSTDLGRTGVFDAVDPNQLLAALGSGTDRTVDPDRARALAMQLGAGLYLLGSVFEVEGRVRLTASLYDRSRGGRPIATRTVEGAVADVLPLVSRLAVEIARAAPARARGGVRLVWAGDSVDVLGSPSADGRLLSFTDWYTGDLAVRDLVTGTSRRVTNKGDWRVSSDYAEYSRVSPDGRRIAYAWFTVAGGESWTYELRLLELDGSLPRTLLGGDSTAWLSPAAWKPDGSAVLVAHWLSGVGTLLRVSVPSGAVDTVRTLEHGFGPIRISADGRWLAYDLAVRGDPGQQRDIHVMAADGSNDRVVVRSPANDVLLDWVPDRPFLLFWSDRGTAPGIWALRIADGRAAGEPVLVRSDMQWLHPLGFVGGDVLYAINASERQVHSITIDWERGEALEAPAPAVHATAHTTSSGAWSPDGSRLAYLSHMPGGAPLTSSVAIRELAAGAVTEYPVPLENPQLLQWLDGNRLLVWGRGAAGGGFSHFTLDLTSGVLEPFAAAPGAGPGDYVRSLIVSGDGRTQYFFRWVGSTAQLLARDVATGRERLLASRNGIGPIAVTNDGAWVVFTGYDRDRDENQLSIVAAYGGPSRIVHVSPGIANVYRSVAWSGDGRHLLFARAIDDARTIELRRLRLADGDDRLVHRGSAIHAIRPHPDGRRFVFTAGDSRREVWALERVAELLR
jgi:TolB-like protein